MLDARSQFAPLPLLFDPPLVRLTLQALLSLRCGEYRKPHGNVARHVLQPLNLGISEDSTRCSASKDIDMLELE